ncbi:chondroitin sulfate proteoglycan 4 [Diprion similis]|uniref:chondroitin sulfate proteoglycan 4 n=1 Tax=Diprion similis TaxID=362088 RepID=UPI001EF925B1|nr:chondroitin sulfate proteoglycan 4 [Diprion similis]
MSGISMTNTMHLNDVRLLLFLAGIACTLLGCCQTDEKVSFYGASYIHLPVQEARGASDVSFKFRTHLPDAMLLLAAGKTDYCLVKLVAGRLKVHINLGAGESEIASPRGLTLNDLSWHEVNLTRREANITLQIDVIHATRSVLPGRFFELNIHYGVYIGGQGDFNELFLGHTEYLRGCMADIHYNGANVVESARLRKGQSVATGVAWGCSTEFDASRDTEISFVEDGAFIAIPKPIPRTGTRWELDLKTVSESGLLLYNAGQSLRADYLGVEIYERKIRLLMNTGNGPTELIHGTTVADGKWHRVVVEFDPNVIGISVDSSAKTLALPKGSRYLDLAGTLYIGGTELNQRAKALGKGLKSGDVSYKGCIRKMLLDNKPLGLPDVKVSQGIVIGCVWGFPCVEAEPCVDGASCSQLGVNSFKCSCDQALCIKPSYAEDYKVYSSANLPVDLEILSLSPLMVSEGDHVLVTSQNIAMILDIAKYGVEETGVIFTLVTPPSHGTLALDLLNTKSDHTFTLQEINQDKIQYMHDGSENTEDSMILELKLVAGASYTLPGYLQGRLRFPLHVNVTPVNDPPLLEIPTAKVLRLAQGTRKVLNKELVWAVDADTPLQSLVYTVLRGDMDAGHVERLTYPTKPIDSFSQAELQQGLIAYVHRGNAKSNAMLGLQVSDGIESSQPAYLRVSAYPLQIKLQYNTGLVVVHRSFSHVTPANLSFITNSDDSSIEIRYDIVSPAQFGTIQKFKDVSGSWSNVDHFTSKDVELDWVRYLHNVGSPSQDEFKFQASVREVRTQHTFDFRITFIDLELKEAKRQPLTFTNSVEVVVGSQNLKFQTNPLTTPVNKIVFTIEKSPKYGGLFLTKKAVLKGDTFTQEDLDAGKLRYKLLRKSFSNINDEMVFKVKAPQCVEVASSLDIRYNLQRNGNGPETVDRLRVSEGGSVPLKIMRFDGKNYGVTSLTYNITVAPLHGWLKVVNDSFNSNPRRNATYFTSSELAAEHVHYVHDDTETPEDTFAYVAISSERENFMYVGNFHVEIAMRNDNPPTRLNARVFHVVLNGERILTNKVLEYIDADLDTKPSDIVYSRRDAANGGLYKVTNPSVQIYEFTQQDVNQHQILFKHHGEEAGKVELGVTDGHFYTAGVLEVQASPPYVNPVPSNGSVVKFNESTALTTAVLQIETNVNANESEIIYTVIEKPRHGVLLKRDKETATFTQDDLAQGEVIYKHRGGSLTKDSLRFRVSAKKTEAEGHLTVKVYPESYWEPLIVANNQTVLVEEATSVLLSKKHLEVMHPKISPSQIIYLVKERPRFGYLELQSPDQEHSDETRDDYVVTSFEQSTINEGKLHYVQSEPNQTQDSFTFDVTNGITWLRDLALNLVVIPDKLYLASGNLSVVEGKSVVLDESDFPVITEYYAGKVTDYRVIEKPKHGTIIDSTKNSLVKKFPQKHLAAGVILYRHSDDETLNDSLRLVAIAGEKTSEPFELRFKVIPVNDEIPFLVNKTTLNVWQGGSVFITSKDLATLDNDTEPENLRYHINSIRNGFICLKQFKKLEIRNFTQQQINNMEIMFTHTNESDAEFIFTIDDGVHTTSNYTMLVVTREVRLSVKNNNPLNVFPLTRKPISADLLSIDSTDGNRKIKYIVRSGPHLGRIIMETSEGIWLEVDRFYQSDLNHSKVIYEHTKQFMDLSANDSFVFDVEAHFAKPVLNQLFQIEISVSSGGLDRYISAESVRVEEGGSGKVIVNVTGIVKFLQAKAGLENPTVVTRLATHPSHGHVMLLPDLNVTTFTLPEIEGGKVAYFHDHSDTTEDRIHFSVYLTPGHILLCNTTVPVIVTPINDEPFKLVTNAPFVSVVRNQNQTITRDNLLTTDPDTDPQELSYDVISGPTYGRLLLLPQDQNSSEVHQVNKFSQHDVDSNRLVYEHSGPLQAASFYFRVSDGRFNPVYRVLNFHVLPIRLNVTVVGPVSLQQGSNVALISEDNIRLETNARQDLVTYNVTKAPKFGTIYVRDAAAVSFRHTDLLSKSVMFMQTDMTMSNDSLELAAQLSDFEAKHVVIDVIVEPLMIVNPMVAIAGERNRLDLRYMDATPLAKLTSSNPMFVVTRKPKYARIKKIIRSSGDRKGTREREVSKFSHQELISGLIYVVCKKMAALEIEGTPDSFGFVLAASIFQPAAGNFNFRIKYNVDEFNMTLGSPMDPVGHEGEMAIAPNMSNDYLLILGMLLGVFLLGVVVIITIRCRHNRYKHAEDNKAEPSPGVGVMPLPRPPDHLMPATPHLKRFGNDHDGITGSSTPLPVLPSMPATLPQCKVIPLSPLDSIAGSEVDVSSRYPYGVPDGDEWSSFDTSDLPCPSATTPRANPLLRRNQYWV